MLIAALNYTFDAKKIEDWHAFQSLWVPAREFTRENFSYYIGGDQRITMDEAHGLQQMGVKIDIKGVDGTMVVKMRDNPAKKWSYDEDVTPRDLVSGRAVQITLPDVGLLLIDEVTWLEDECTQVLQEHLNQGWRIIAVCPPNAQRRPDYILGRRRKD